MSRTYTPAVARRRLSTVGVFARAAASVGLLSLVLAPGAMTTPATAQGPQVITVNLGDETGPVLNGAGGALYGLSDPGVPSNNVLAPLHIATISQKGPNGPQHPNGDVLEVENSFLQASPGGFDILYMQDGAYPGFPYNGGRRDPNYPTLLGNEMSEIMAYAANQPASWLNSLVIAPYNEPNGDWYNNTTINSSAPGGFLSDWEIAYKLIKSYDPKIRIAGPLFSGWNETDFTDFLSFAKANNVLPQIICWHEESSGSNGSLATYVPDYNDYVALEAADGISIPVDINEWGTNLDLDDPGQMIQYMSMFENTKVYASQGYWNAAGNLSGEVVQNNEPNGGWWLEKMIADMTGDTVLVTPPQPNVSDTLQGIASIDTAKKQAHIVVGGTASPTNVVINNIPSSVFGSTVDVTVDTTAFTGQAAEEAPPTILSDVDYPVTNGSITVPLTAMNASSAYEIVLTPGGAGTRLPVDSTWTADYLAASATIVGGTVQTQNSTGYATLGGEDVADLDTAASSVTFNVNVPVTGQYDLGIYYGNLGGEVAQQVLTVDGQAPQFVNYPATLNGTYWGRNDSVVTLTAGAHTIELAESNPQLGTALGVGSITLDELVLTELPTNGQPAYFPELYLADRAQSTGNVSYMYNQTGQVGSGYVTVGAGGETTFSVYAPSTGYYDLGVSYSSPGPTGTVAADLTLGGQPLDGADLPATPTSAWATATSRVYLVAGINLVGVAPADSVPLNLDDLTEAAAKSGASPVLTIDADDPSNTLTGDATVIPNEWAPGGAYVDGVRNGPGNALTMDDVKVARSGQYMLVVHYSNAEVGGSTGGAYNANIISRPLDISVNGAPSTRVWLPNTNSWSNFWSVGVPVTLNAGTNSIEFFNDPSQDGPPPTLAKGEFGNALPLNGIGQYAELPTGIVSGLNNFTISTWVNTTSDTTNARVFDFGRDSGTGVNHYMYLTVSDAASGGVPRFGITTTGPSGEQQLTGTAALPTGVWTNIVVTLSGTTGTLYVNGVAVATNPNMTLTPSSLGLTNQNYLGKSEQFSAPYLTGSIDDFNIYNYALNAAQVQALQTQPGAGNVADYTFDQLNGITAPDSSGNGHNATVDASASQTSPFAPYLGSFDIASLVAPVPEPCITTVLSAPLTVTAGQSVCVSSGGSVHGPVTVQPGGALWVSGGSIKGPLNSSGALSLTLCGATINGPLTVSASTDPVLVGGTACPGNTITGPVKITNNTGGASFLDNTVNGPVTLTGNIHGFNFQGNTITGPVTNSGNS